MTKVLILLFLLTASVASEKIYCQQAWWVFLDSKCGPCAPEPPASVLNKRSLTFQDPYGDLPVCSQYIAALNVMGYKLLAKSRWLNAVCLQLSPEQVKEINDLPFVIKVQKARQLQVSKTRETSEEAQAQTSSITFPVSAFWGAALNQTEMLGLDLLHLHRYTGKNVCIAVFDNGFPQVNFMSAFFNTKIKATYDFVSDETDVYNNTGTHGTLVLSTMASYMPGIHVGTAFDADYILAVTENDMSETLQEEYNWVRAAEWADSLGADIFTTSLGYTVFDDPGEDHTYADMDGNTTVITNASDAAAARGILVINSAGNEGNTDWRYISAPADGDSVFAIGAVNGLRELASFSSRGPTFDGRIKPDMMAQGAGSAVVTLSGGVMLYNGTSFSGPLIAGTSACLMQAGSDLSGYETGIQLRNTGHLANTPNNDMGYGIPNASKAFENIMGYALQRPKQVQISLYPNPAKGAFQLSVVFPGEGKNMNLEIYDLQGRRIMHTLLNSIPFYNIFHFRESMEMKNIPAGIYLLKVSDDLSGELMDTLKLFWEGR